MLVGINYPWIDYGWDFGDPPSAWVFTERLSAWREAKRKQIDEDFRQFASQRIFAVRWFLLADGLNYGMAELAPRKEGKEWSFDPLPARHPFYACLLDDFEYVVRVCVKYGIKLFPSLIDFSWCHSGMVVADNPRTVKGGRYAILRDPKKRKDFFDRILDPLLVVSNQSRNSIYAWELINEPEWVVREIWKRGRNRNVTKKEMKEFIAEGMQRINSMRLQGDPRGFESSVGFAHWKTFHKWDCMQLGITLNQFHYYAQGHSVLPANLHSAEQPCIVGEFSTAPARKWPDLHKSKNQTIANRLLCIEEKGYPACFMWSARAVDPATRWTEKSRQEVAAYCQLRQADSIRR